MILCFLHCITNSRSDKEKKVPDHWVNHLVDTKAKEEDGVVTLEATFCRSGGKLRWYKNRVEIFHGPKYNFITEGPVQKLQINKMIPDDSGRYICSVNDIETKSWLAVEGAKPEYDFYLQLPVKNTVFRTKPVILECHVNSSDCPIKWLKGEKQIETNDPDYKFYLDGTRCVLRINHVKRSDEGKFTCVIDDGSGKQSECYLYIEEPQWRFSQKLPQKLSVKEKECIVLEVEVEDLEAECEWYFKGEMITPEDFKSGKYEIVVDGFRRIMRVNDADPVKDAGFYECRTGVMTTDCQVSVQPLLRIVKELQDVEAIEKRDITLSAQLSKAVPTVSWLKDGKRILPTASNLILNDGVNYSLTLKNVSFEDAGRYTMKVMTLETSADITVREENKPPSIGHIPKLYSIPIGKPIEINVPFKGYPPPTVTWLKDGKPIDVSSVDIRNTNSESTLRIPVSNASHQGEYTLRLENSSGKDEVAIAVQICDRPDPPNGPLRVTQVKKESCNLNWNHPDNDGGSPITGYVIEKQDVLRGDWEEVGTVSANTLSFPVKNLTANKKYAFRVKAKNKINTSEPLAVTSPITAKDPYDPPSSPEDLLVKDVDFDYVSLNWKPPVNNGGAPIDKYIIEKKEEHGNWIIADKIDGDAFSVTVKNLVQDKNYDFRVTAVNKAGLGTPCTGISVKTSPKIVRPFITKNSLKDITVKVGQEIKLNVLYRAKPSADCKWEFKGQEIQLTDRMKINFDDKMCELIIKDATRADVGIYKITLSNSAGADSAKANVVVLGPPGKMKKPLKVADVTSDSAVLSWEPPDDDGGKPIQSYVIEKREVGGQWTPAGTTSGTRLKVTNLKEGRQYDFRVMAENSVGVGEPLVTDEPIVAKNPYDRPGATNKPNVVNRDRKHIVIEWKQPEDDGGAPVVGYIVERKESESGSWKPVHRDDYITGLKFTDNQVKANAPYEYRVKAVNKAGAGDASPSTGVVLAKPEKEAPKIDDGKIPTISGQREIRINAGEPLEISLDYVGSPNNVVTWTKDNEPFGTSVKIEDVDENTTLSVPITRRSDSGNYKVSIKNDQGEDEASIKVIVQDVPSQCMGPLVPSNTTKISTTLKWDIPEDNGGSAITGYVVEKCKEGSTTWEPVGTCDPYDTKIIADKLEPMQNYNFRVKAENKSGLSEPLQTISPVLIKPPYDVPSAPSEPIITDFDTDHISIEWEKPLNDGGNPISGYVVEMRDGRGDWIPATTKPVTGTQFTATGLKPNHPYEFRVRAENDGGLGDASHPSKQQKAVSPINPPGPTESPVVTHVDHESATITWKPPEDNGGDKITKYDIEMRTNNGDWISVGEANGRDKQLTIPKLKEGSEVSFRIRAENSAGPGTPSSPSDVVTIKDPPSPPAFSNISKLKDITVRAGQPFFASAQYTAVPEPAVECIHDNTPVISDDIYTAKAENGVVTVGSKCAKRDDCGVYKILLKNSEGVVSASFLVNVLDVPLKPDGPLDVSGVDHDRCTLRWNPPKDDGGSPITSYVIEKRPVGSDKWLKACPSTPSTFANVQNLENGVNYEFRVIAENINGRSEPLTVDDSVRIKSPHKAPDSPDTPRCIDHTEDSITIAWNKPLSDGGAPINGYLVEIRDSPNSSWKPLFTAPKSGRTATAKNLEDGHVYEFRVSAVNNAGQSPWAETDEPIEARPQDFTPYIPYTSTKTIKVKEGEPIEIDIPFVASPLPESIFSKNGYNIPEDDRHIFRTETNRAILSIPSAELSDAGPYTCLLKNNAGQCEHGVNVVVIGKPSKPEGPLIATDCSAYGCTLTWSPPKTENGAPITNYIIEKCDPRTGIWEVVSKFCRNPQYEVFDLDENNIYSFRVSAENEAGISEPLEIDKPVKAQYPASTPSAPRSLRVDENKFDRVTLTWDEPLKDNGAKITGYIVECKPAGSSEWDELTITPTRDTSFSVEHLLPSKSYDFRVCAVNSMGKSDYENLDKPLKTKDVLKPPDKPSPPEALSVGDTFAQIVWDTPSNLLDDIPLTYKVQKKIEGNDTWEAVTVSPGSDNFLTVFGLPTNSNVEFRVCASNSAGDSEWSDTSGKFKVTSYPNGKPPTFIRQLEESVNVNPGSYIRLEVDFTGLPQPDVKWLKNGLQIIPGIKYAIQTKDQHSTLILQDIWDVDDGTEFTCEITNPIGSETTTSKLNVRVPPKISKFDRNLSAIVGEPVKLQIPVEATRGLQFDVKKLDDSNLLDVNDLFNVKDEDGLVSISLKEAKLDDSGEYVIYMKNDAGVANTHFSVDVKGPPGKPEGPLEPFDVNKTSCKLSWKPPHEDGNSRIINYIVEKHDVAKDSDQWVPIDINCKDTSLTVDNLLPDHEYEFRVKAVNNIGEGTPLYSSNTIVAALPFGPPKCMSAPEVTAVGSDSVRLSWVKAISDSEVSPINYHIEKRLKDSDEWYPVSTGGLLTRNSVEVPHLLEGREYEFRVIAENEAGCGNPSPPTDPVLISDPYALKAPVIVSKFSDMTVNENTSNKFQVEVANAANADITWYKGTTELHSGSDYTISKIGDVCSLLLNNVKPEDNDETFTFKIKNPAGSRSCRANLIVNSKPRIKLPARYQDVQELTSKDKDITIKIPYTANPMPADTWYINGQPLNTIDNDDVTSTLTSTGATLHIRNPEILGDSGKVELRLENPLGTADAFVSYVVSGKPSIPMNLKADTVYDDCATLSWQPPQSDGGSRITDYCLEMMDGSNEGKWEKVAACRSTRYVVPNLTPNNLYHFRVSAINQNGQSEPSVLLENVCTEHKVDSKYKKAPYGTDNEGKPIRGIEGQAPEDYDRVFHDIWKTNVNPHAPVVNAGSIYDKYDVYEEIGRSSFAVVHRAVDKSTGRNYAVKFIDTSEDGDMSAIEKEIDMMGNLVDSNIVNLREAYQTIDESALVYELLTGDTLVDKLNNSQKITEPEVINLVRQVCQAVKTLHDNNIAHLDLKPESFIASTKKNPQQIKLADFSLANKVQPEDKIQVSLASSEFAAPEILNHECVGYATDMWAIGSIAYTMLSGEAPAVQSKDDDRRIRSKDFEIPAKLSDQISENGKDFINKLLKHDKNARMDIYQALDHPWLKDSYSPDTYPTLHPNYNRLSDNTKNKYQSFGKEDYIGPKIGFGQTAWYSRRIRREPRKYDLYTSSFDRREYVPRIYIFKHDSYVLEGETAELHARVISLSEVNVEWSKGSEIKQSARTTKSSRKGEYVLEIRKCKLEDGGEYTFKANNKYGDRSVNVNLHVERVKEKEGQSLRMQSVERSRIEYPLIDIWQEPNKPPAFSHILRTRVVQAGSSVKLTCTATGRPTPKISWFKGSVDITNDDKYINSCNHGSNTLQILRATVSDSGLYACRAENSLGSADTSSQLFVQGGYSSRTSRREKYSESTSEYYSSSRRTTHETLTHSYESSANSDQMKSRQRREISYAPSINEDISSITLFEGAVLQMRSNISGRPKPKISWYKNNDLISIDERVQQSYENNEALLTVNPINIYDSGEYIVVAENDQGKVSSTAVVEVRHFISSSYPPATDSQESDVGQVSSQTESVKEATKVDNDYLVIEDVLKSADLVNIEDQVEAIDSSQIEPSHPNIRITKHLYGTILCSGDALRLSCEIDGKSPYTAIWYRNNRVIPENPDFIKTTEDNCVIVSVSEMYPEDTGTFTLELKGDTDEVYAKSTCSIYVYEEDDASLINPLVAKHLSSQNVKVGETAMFKVSTNVPCQAQWTFEEKPICELPAVCESKSDAGLTQKLSIPDVTFSNQGTYYLTLTDEKTNREITLAAFLNVYDQ